MSVRVRVQDTIYQLHQRAWSAWARRRYRDDFDGVARFCLFVGYPRSGHSIVGALLNAHRHAVISHELNAPELILQGCSRDTLYARILARADWFNLRGNTSNHSYQVRNQWQGRFAELRVIGDKRGGAVTRCIAAHPDFLSRVRALVGVPLRLIHVVRNPFDNISAISIWHDMSLEESVGYYFSHCQTTKALGELCDPSEMITVRHEDMIRDPRSVLSDLCEFLGLDLYPGYTDDCCSLIFAVPTFTRRRHAWPPPLVRAVERRVRAYPFLADYEFHIAGDPP
jgi:sulfotransferase family protein